MLMLQIAFTALLVNIFVQRTVHQMTAKVAARLMSGEAVALAVPMWLPLVSSLSYRVVFIAGLAGIWTVV